MVKLVENSYRDVNLAFSHQIAEMAHQAELDPYKIIDLANHHPRVAILKPSAGVGGHCIAVDPWFLIETFPKQSTLLSEARAVNDNRPISIVARIEEYARQWYAIHAKPLKLILFGLAYKADVDDIRESPALLIAQQLAGSIFIDLQVCDPYVNNQCIEGIAPSCFISMGNDLSTADALVFAVKHSCFVEIQNYISPHHKIFDYCGVTTLLIPSSRNEVSHL